MSARRSRIKVVPNLGASRSRVKTDLNVCTDHVNKSANKVDDLVNKNEILSLNKIRSKTVQYVKETKKEGDRYDDKPDQIRNGECSSLISKLETISTIDQHRQNASLKASSKSPDAFSSSESFNGVNDSSLKKDRVESLSNLDNLKILDNTKGCDITNPENKANTASKGTVGKFTDDAVKPTATGQFVNGKYLPTEAKKDMCQHVLNEEKEPRSVVEKSNEKDAIDIVDKTPIKLPGPIMRRFLGAKHKFKPNLFDRARQIEEGLKRERKLSGGKDQTWNNVPRTRKNSQGDNGDSKTSDGDCTVRSQKGANEGVTRYRTRRISSGERGLIDNENMSTSSSEQSGKDQRKRARSRSASNSSDDDLRRKIRQPPPPLLDRRNEVEEAPITTPLLELDDRRSTESPNIRRLSDGTRISFERTNYVLKRRKHESKQRFAKGVPGRGTMTMFDLIYYNPDNGTEMKTKEQDLDTSQEENQSKSDKMEESSLVKPSEPVVEEEDSLPVPQVKVGANGEIILDESSTLLETTASKKAKEDLSQSPVVVENSSRLTNYGTWSKKRRYNEWSERETLKFYRALSMVGSDFSMMETMFKKRTRHELKLKFKKEEKVNAALVDKCLSQRGQFTDIKDFAEDSDEEEEKVDRPGRGRKRKSKGPRKTKFSSRGNFDSSSEDADVSDTSRSPASRRKIVQRPEKKLSRPKVTSSLPRTPNTARANIPHSNVTSTKDSTSESNVSPTPLKKLPGVHFPPALLAANPSLAGAKPGSLVVVASPSKTDPNSQLLHVYMVSEKKAKNATGLNSNPRTQSPTPSRNLSPANRSRSGQAERLSIDPAVVRAVDRKRTIADRNNQKTIDFNSGVQEGQRRQRTLSEGNMISPSRLRNLSEPQKSHGPGVVQPPSTQAASDSPLPTTSSNCKLLATDTMIANSYPSMDLLENEKSPSALNHLPIARKSKPVPNNLT